MFSFAALSTGLSKSRPGAAIVLATDGVANVGVGSGKDQRYYQTVALEAKQHGTNINVITLEGEDCSMENIGLAADLTSGQVSCFLFFVFFYKNFI